ncbi:MAG TPA: hypothetical protein VGL58_02095 [Caulobacteraceae bacterium]|jgi:hypothetical protein
MQTWTFLARILPERVPIRFGQPIDGTWASDLGFEYTFSLRVSDAHVVMNLSAPDGIDLFTLRNCALEQIGSLVALVGYERGLAFEIDILAANRVDADGTMFFGIGIPSLMERRQKGPEFELSNDLVLAVMADVGAQIALKNFKLAIRVAVDSGFYCFRAIEAAMQSMKEHPSDQDAKGWTQLRGDLRVERGAIDFVKKHSDLPRHGKPSVIMDVDRGKVFRITDEIVGRYLKYLVGGRHALAEEAFPMLTAD